MSFLDSLAKGAVQGLNAMKEYGEKCQHIKSQYEKLSDDELWDIVNGNTFFNKSFTDKAVARRVLKDRGLV